MARVNLEEYEPVDERIQRFYRQHPEGRIEADLIDFQGEIGATRWVVRSRVYRDSAVDTPPAGVGHAFEVDGAPGANKTSALENCETSAIGRALADAGFTGSRRTTREEMMKVKGPEVKARIQDAESLDALSSIFDELKADGIEGQFRDLLTARKSELAAGAVGDVLGGSVAPTVEQLKGRIVEIMKAEGISPADVMAMYRSAGGAREKFMDADDVEAVQAVLDALDGP